jgi:biopolymer transport protein ExbB
MKLTPAFPALLIISSLAAAAAETPWWHPAWTVRRTLTIDAPSVRLPGDPGSAPVLVRLSDADFTFDSARDDGGDLRFTTVDGTVLPHQIERWDRALNEAFVWVRVDGLTATGETRVLLYSGNPGEAPEPRPAAETWDAATGGVWHFSEDDGKPVDASSGAASAEGSGIPVAGALIGGGLRFTGQNAVTLRPGPAAEWKPGASLTCSLWVRPAGFGQNAVIFSRRGEGGTLVIGEDGGVPFVEVSDGTSVRRAVAPAPLALDAWRHLAVTADAGAVVLWIDGERAASVEAAVPALNGPMQLGHDAGPGALPVGFNGEVDELQLASAARSAAWLRFTALSQGAGPEAGKLVRIAETDETASPPEKAGFLKEHLGIFAEISKSLTFDGWAVIVLCGILALAGAAVAVSKLITLHRIDRANAAFLRRWETGEADVLVRTNAEADAHGGDAAAADEVAARAPLQALHRTGLHEIRRRLDAEGAAFRGLSGRSIAAIRARLEGGLHETEERLNGRLVFLTLSIAGGPYLGLLGTVIGVMITFAVIAKSGEVEVNSIAPGIAGALLATVAGLAVAIPALFFYSYLSSRIASALSTIRQFIEEFITRAAEAYPTEREP